MAKKLLPLPSPRSKAVEPTAGTYDPLFYAFLAALLAVVSEQARQIEALRAGVNEARQSPGATFPPIAPF